MRLTGVIEELLGAGLVRDEPGRRRDLFVYLFICLFVLYERKAFTHLQLKSSRNTHAKRHKS